ncbi:unnamed protein product [Boreogadus saida]
MDEVNKQGSGGHHETGSCCSTVRSSAQEASRRRARDPDMGTPGYTNRRYRDDRLKRIDLCSSQRRRQSYIVILVWKIYYGVIPQQCQQRLPTFSKTGCCVSPTSRQLRVQRLRHPPDSDLHLKICHLPQVKDSAI